MVHSLETTYDINRSDIYEIRNRVLDALKPTRPGPKSDPIPILQHQIAILKEENTLLRDKLDHLEDKLSNAVIVDKERIDNLVLTATTTPSSHRGISDILAAAFGEEHRRSQAYISKLISYYGTVSGLILIDERVTSKVEQAAADEIFFSKTPVLTMVELDSCAIAAIEASSNRDGQSWEKLFQTFPNLNYLVSDLAKGLRKGIELIHKAIIHQPDLWHLIRDMAKVTRKLEATTSSFLKQEDNAKEKLKKGKIYKPTLAKISAKVSANLEWLESYYQAIESLLESFTPIVTDTPTAPHLRSRAQAEAKLESVVTTLKSLADPRLEGLTKELSNHKSTYFAFLDHLQTKIDSIELKLKPNCPLNPPQIRQLIVKELLMRNQLSKDADPSITSAYNELWKEITQKLLPYLKNYKEVAKAIGRLIYSPKRASSLSETVNSLLRRLQQIKRHPSQEFLYLAALKHNMTSFNQGKREGKSPFDILGVDLGVKDWLSLLRTYQLPN
jgi:hypothetical protein